MITMVRTSLHAHVRPLFPQPAVSSWPGWLLARDPNVTAYNQEVPVATRATGFTTPVIARWSGFIYVQASDYYKFYLTQLTGALKGWGWGGLMGPLTLV